MLLEKLLKEFNFSTNIFNWEEFKLFDQYFERILVSKGTFLIKEGETERYSYFVFDGILPVSYTHLTLPTNSLV